MRKLIVIIAFILMGCSPEEPGVNLTPYQAEPQEFHKVFRLINSYRLDNNKNQLIYSSVIQGYCRVRVDYIILTGVLDHSGFYDLNLVEVLGVNRVSETIGSGYEDSDAIFNAWRLSTEHNRALLGNFSHIGVYSRDGVWAAIFVLQ